MIGMLKFWYALCFVWRPAGDLYEIKMWLKITESTETNLTEGIGMSEGEGRNTHTEKKLIKIPGEGGKLLGVPHRD